MTRRPRWSTSTESYAGVGFSELSRHALDQAIVLANWHGAHVTVFHVFSAPQMPADLLVMGTHGREAWSACFSARDGEGAAEHPAIRTDDAELGNRVARPEFVRAFQGEESKEDLVA